MSKEESKEPDDQEQSATEAAGTQVEDAEIVESTPAPGQSSDRSARSATRLPLVVALAALIVVVVSVGIGYQRWEQLRVSLRSLEGNLAQTHQQQEQLHQQLGAVESAFTEQKQQLEAQRQALAAQDQKLADERQRLQQQAREMEKTLAAVYDRMGRSSNAWMAAEAEYLMRVANHRLQLERDVKTAIQALQAADERLRETGDPGWTRVRELLATEIAALQGVDKVDRVGLSSRLIGLTEQVDELKMAGLQYTPAQPKQAAQRGGQEGQGLDQLLKDSWEGFKSIMVIRHRDKPVSAMLAPEEQFFVYRNLQLQLEAARLALLKGDPDLYRISLQQAAGWIREFFDPETTATQAVLQALSDLQAVDLRPRLPDISQSLSALQQRMESVAEEGGQ